MIVLNSVLPAFIIIALGYFLKRRGIIKDETDSFINNLAYYLVLPCMIFAAIYKTPFKEIFNPGAVAGLYLAVLVVFGIAVLISPALPQKKRGVFATSSFRSNIAYIGFPIAYSLYGQAGLGKISVITGFMAP
ncbi:MAG TPA: hypothetical protein ENN43_00905, partial [bacterium]|nr:hypothetical protein [bacterium]